MARIPLNGGAYTARSIIANAQTCKNLYPEINNPEDDAPVEMTHYLTPGLKKLLKPSTGAVRGAWRAANGALYVVIGNKVYFVDLTNILIDFGWKEFGTIAAGTTPVSMCDNGGIMVLVDGSPNGYWWSLGSYVFNQIVDDAFYGANFVCFLDGFFIFNRPVTNQFYVSPNFWNGTDPFDPLYIASKIGGPDQIIAVASIHRELWLIGQITSEVWFNSGGADFPFERLPGVFLDHGMLAGWSIGQIDIALLWLGRERQGQLVAYQGVQYSALRVSTHAIEQEWGTYAKVNDVIGFCYQQEGHAFYVLIFPSADKTWVYDLSTKLWHQRTWTDINGVEHRIRMNCATNAYNMIIGGDWENGWIYQWDLQTYDDGGDPIVRKRGFPHIVKDGKRISYDSIIFDMQVGQIANLADQEDPTIQVRWSDTRGASWGNVVTIPFGKTGDYLRSLLLRNLGMARDRVFELSWSFAWPTALQGPWIEVTPAET